MSSHELVFLASGILGFGPAMAVLYHALRTYDYPYTERSFFDSSRVFLALAVGVVFGTIVGWITLSFRGGGLTLVALILALVLFALFEEAFKLVYLNRKRYRGRFDTTFCGVSLGVGSAALVGAGNAYINGPNVFLPLLALQLGAFSASLAFVHSATGGIIGLGCSRGRVLRPFLQAIGARTLHALMLVPFFVWAGLPSPQDASIPLFSLAAAVVFGVLLYLYVYQIVLPSTLPVEMRRERRRVVRKKGRESGGPARSQEASDEE